MYLSTEPYHHLFTIPFEFATRDIHGGGGCLWCLVPLSTMFQLYHGWGCTMYIYLSTESTFILLLQFVRKVLPADIQCNLFIY